MRKKCIDKYPCEGIITYMKHAHKSIKASRIGKKPNFKVFLEQEEMTQYEAYLANLGGKKGPYAAKLIRDQLKASGQ